VALVAIVHDFGDLQPSRCLLPSESNTHAPCDSEITREPFSDGVRSNPKPNPFATIDLADRNLRIGLLESTAQLRQCKRRQRHQAAEIVGEDPLIRLEAGTMLPASTTATKYSSCLNVNRVRKPLDSAA